MVSRDVWRRFVALVSRIARGLLAALVLIGILGLLGAVAYSYSTLSASPPRVEAISPSITGDISSLFRAGADLASGDLLGAAERIIEGVDFDVEVDITNEGILPVYLGTSDHILVLNGVEVTAPIAFKGDWVGPNSTTTILLEVTLHLTELPGAVVLGIVQGGLIDVQLKSTIGWGIFSKTIHTQVTRFRIIESVESIVRGLLPN
jgi:hypothetical protein